MKGELNVGLKKGWGLALATLGFGLTMGVTTQAQAAKPIPDISEWQGRLTGTQVHSMKSQVNFVINRVQYGYNYEDNHHRNNESLYVKYGVPFGSYDFATFKSAAGARAEAQRFYQRSNKKTRFYILDFETTSMGSSAANAAVKAWYQEMRKLTKKHLIFYSYQSFATTYANSSRQAFDAQWIANYSHRPTVPFSLWQYTSTYYLSSLNQRVDNSLYDKATVSQYHSLNWWLNKKKKKTTKTTAVKAATPAKVAAKPVVKPAVQAKPAPVKIKYSYSKYKVGQRAYLRPGATHYYGGEAIPADKRKQPYTIKAVKAVTTSRSKQVVYVAGLNKWVLAQDVTGFWRSKSTGKFKIKVNMNVYRDAKLTQKAGTKVLKGKKVTGRVVRSGSYYRIKLDKGGYVSAKARNSSFKKVKYAFSSYKAGQNAYIAAKAKTYYGGAVIPASAKLKPYKITKTKTKVTSRSRKIVYVRHLKHWVRTQDMIGYWKKGSKGTFKVRSKANVYKKSTLKHKVRHLTKNTRISGKVIKKGHLYRVKLSSGGYVTAKVSVISKVK